MPNIEAINVANVILLDQANRVLLLRRALALKGAGLLGLPGGMVDEGELPQDAGFRELTEETGVEKNQTRLDRMSEFLLDTPDQSLIILNILARLTTRVSIKLDPKEHTDYLWVPEADLGITSGLMPGVPTMVSMTMFPGIEVFDSSIVNGTRIQQVKKVVPIDNV